MDTKPSSTASITEICSPCLPTITLSSLTTASPIPEMVTSQLYTEKGDGTMKNLIIVLFVLTFSAVNGQQSWQLSQYLSNGYLVNPASAGERQMLDLNITYRQQWMGSQYAPRSFYVSGTSRIFAPRTLTSETLPTSQSESHSNDKGKRKNKTCGRRHSVSRRFWGIFLHRIWGFLQCACTN